VQPFAELVVGLLIAGWFRDNAPGIEAHPPGCSLASEQAWAVSAELLSASGGAVRSVYY
jgi:hypothetical protein